MENYTPMSDTIRSFFTSVFGWMAAGLSVTAATAWYLSDAHPEMAVALLQNPMLSIVFFLIQLGLVLGLSVALLRLSFGVALSMFLLYAFLNGITLSFIFLAYTQESIALTFGIAAAMFLAMAVFGAVTRINLTAVGTFSMMALFGIIIASLANLYFQSSMLNFIISVIGVFVFSALTAYDMQRLTGLAIQLQGRTYERGQIALLGALMLYLDFINLFLMLLSFTGKHRE